MTLKAARRYAKAYFQIALERNELDEVLRDVHLIHNTIESSRELVLFLKSPVINSGIKRKALDELFMKQTGTLTREFLHFLVRKGREDMLEAVTEGFLALYNVHIGRVEADVVTALPLTDEQKQKLTSALESSTGKSVQTSYRQDPELIGGLSVRIGDTVIDGTVKNKISQLKSLFAKTAVD